MVQIDVGVVGAAVKDAAAVAAPAGGVHGHGEGPHGGDVGHDGLLVVGGEDGVAGDADGRRLAVQVVEALAVGPSVSRSVTVVGLKTR